MINNSQSQHLAPQVQPTGVSDFVGLKEIERPSRPSLADFTKALRRSLRAFLI
jgi:hypothetical protein